ncbi:glycosyltransferase [Vibrio aestuarianus]|uniref:Glycosyltransferase n=1 Tax=Vibrio aestuarianus TaxID=28171 RepID=A0A9X4F7L3_9VIBR|nr:glycosyltransferase [Vibrio aestuarianus]MDE1344950.1 glycosyltransferase [Vibrio aestuarianus]
MLLSIVILSYNRPRQLERILAKLVGIKSHKFNVIIKDDVSPMLHEIEEVVNKYSSLLEVELILHKNNSNLGYDLNLLGAFDINESKYTCLLSDDDFIEIQYLDSLLDELEKGEYDVYFSPYTDEVNNKIYRPMSDTFFPGAVLNSSELIYNSILFSGLVFNNSAVRSLKKDYNFLGGCIYSQVFLSISLIYKSGGYGLLPENVLFLGGDGENYFGKNESAQNSSLLSDREKLTANLDYQMFLLRVVEKIAASINIDVFSSFSKEYCKRLIGYSLRVRAASLSEYKVFMSSVYDKQIPYKYLMLGIMSFFIFIPKRVSKSLYTRGVSSFRKSG